jgi:hypothetical protein
MKYWEIIADNLKKRGWSYGYVSAVDSNGRTIWIVDAHRDGKRFIVRADEKTAFCISPIPLPSLRLLKGIILRYSRHLSEVLVNSSSVTSSDVSTYLRHG